MIEYNRVTCRHPNGDIAITETKQLPKTRECELVLHRLAELEDKIESGQLVELPFAVIDKQTKREADEYTIARKEAWTNDLCYSAMNGFAITQAGSLILLDECGKYTYCPCDRFEVIAEARLEELQEKK